MNLNRNFQNRLVRTATATLASSLLLVSAQGCPQSQDSSSTEPRFRLLEFVAKARQDVEKLLGKPIEEDDYGCEYKAEGIGRVVVTYDKGRSAIVSVFLGEPVTDWKVALAKVGLDPEGVRATSSTNWTLDGSPVSVLGGIKGLPTNWEGHFEPYKPKRPGSDEEATEAQLIVFLKGMVVPFADPGG